MSKLSIPYSRQEVTEEDIAAVVQVLRSEFLTQGTVLPAFEQAMAERHQVAYGVAVGNATQALHIACLAMGIGPGSRVWTSPNSFVASANCALYCGATVDFVDIDPASRNLSVTALRSKLDQAQRSGTLPDLLFRSTLRAGPATCASCGSWPTNTAFASCRIHLTQWGLNTWDDPWGAPGPTPPFSASMR